MLSGLFKSVCVHMIVCLPQLLSISIVYLLVLLSAHACPQTRMHHGAQASGRGPPLGVGSLHCGFLSSSGLAECLYPLFTHLPSCQPSTLFLRVSHRICYICRPARSRDPPVSAHLSSVLDYGLSFIPAFCQRGGAAADADAVRRALCRLSGFFTDVDKLPRGLARRVGLPSASQTFCPSLWGLAKTRLVNWVH